MKSLLLLLACLAPALPLAAGNVVSGDCQNGEGKQVYPEFGNAVYEGRFKDGGWEGEGTLTVPERFTYAGTFTRNRMTGTGTVTYPNGDVYRGAVVDGVFEGEGHYTFANGETLQGVFRGGKIWQGRGYLPMGTEAYYRGSFAEGVFHGEGVARLENGNVYEGAFDRGRMQGAGSMTLRNGDVYRGGFVEGELEGEGDFTGAGDVRYHGAFRRSLAHGYGVARRPDGVYAGEWRDGKRHGAGRFTDAHGLIQFDGQWEDDNPLLETADLRPVLEQIFERTFRGYKATTVAGEKGNLKVALTVSLAPDYRIQGTCETVIRIRGEDYTNKVAVTGFFERDARKLHFRFKETLREDALPDGLEWTHDDEFTVLSLLNDNDHPGEYLLQGNETNGDRIDLGTHR